jgi:hypothetical protein
VVEGGVSCGGREELNRQGAKTPREEGKVEFKFTDALVSFHNMLRGYS